MLFWQILIDGFAISSLYALGATGFTLIFGVTGVLNLSHGAIMVAAAVAAWAASGAFGVGSYLCAAFGIVVGLLLSLTTYYFIVRRLQNSRRIREEEKEIFILTATLLWGIMIQEAIAYLYTNNAKTVLPIVEGVVSILGVRTPANEVFTAIVCWLTIGALWFFVNRTRAGKAVLAASMNPRGVTLLGIELSQVYFAVWAVYGALAGIAGVLLGMFLGVSSYSAGPLTASAFSIVVLGGLGSVSGSLIAAYVVGYLETLTAYLVSPAYRAIPALLLLVAVMYVRSRGLMGRREVMLRRALLSPPVLISLIVVLLASTLPLYVSGYVLGLLTIAYYFGVFSMAWDLLFGFASEVTFAPSFLIGLAAYTAGILDSLYQPPIALCVAAGVAAAMIGGLVLALPALRVRGPYFGLTTLVAVLILQNFVVVAAGLTGGEIGLTIPDVISIDDKVNYWIALGFMAVSGAILYGLTRSPVGLILQASGQDPVQAGALGFNVTKHKLAGVLGSGFFSGFAGALMAFYLGTASVGTFIDVTVGVQVIIGAVLGGRRTILGAVLGAVFLVALGETLRPLGDLATFIVSAVALIVVLFFPAGLLGMVKGAREAT